MTGAQIIEFFETIVDDSLDEETALILLNGAKDVVEDERDWEMLKKLDGSLSAGSGSKDLPGDYRRTISMLVNAQPYAQVPFEQQKQFANSSLRWYLDFANGAFFLLGSGITGTINHFYIKTTPEVALETSPVWPSRFHRLTAFEMAKLYYAIDGGDRGRSWDDKWDVAYAVLKKSMVDWDVKLQARAVENALPADVDFEADLSMM